MVVLGALQDSYQQFQYQLSAKLARCARGRAARAMGGLGLAASWLRSRTYARTLL